jgi:hypothetical protein
MRTSTLTEPITHQKAEEILEPVLNPPPAISVNNITVSFKTLKGVYTAVKDISLTVKKGRDSFPDWPLRLRKVNPDEYYQRHGKTVRRRGDCQWEKSYGPGP